MKNLKVLGIVVLVAVLGVGGWFLVAKQSQNKTNLTQKGVEVKNENQQQEKQVVKDDDQKENDVIKGIKTGENPMFKKFTLAEAEKLKKEKNLVWYEIPELRIKFLVRKDKLKDLEYTIEGVFNMDNHATAYFSSASIVDFFKQKNINGNFTQWGLLKTGKNELNNLDDFSRLIYHNEEYNIYYIPQRQAPIFSGDAEIREYEEYLVKKGLQSNENAIYLGTTRLK